MASSNGRNPRLCRASSANATIPVMSPPVNSGIPNSRFSAIAPPITSARSVAIATNSACTHIPRDTGRGNRSRHSSGRLLPVASPSFADRVWMSMASRLAPMITHSSRYPNSAPAEKLVAKLPGST